MKLRLVFLSGHHQGQVFEFAPGTIVLGRSSQADVQIYDERISRRHCAIKVEQQGTARVKDMGSGNGTFVNDAEIRETVLANGDTLRLGRTDISIAFVKEAADGLPGTMAATPAANLAQTGGPRRGGALPNPLAATMTGPVTCVMCKQEIPPQDLALALRSRGKYLCRSCGGPPIEVPGYRLERSLGEGAMGVVYLARDERNNVPVALKVLKTRGDLGPEDRARFVREVSTSAQLQHPSIVRVLGHGEASRHLYYVMEYVPGLSLSEWIKRQGGPLPLPSVLRVSVQVASALEHARQRNIVHRDVKPENIIVMGDGTAKLADFGLAKNILTSGASGLTRPGDGLGTLPYMPPEQIENALYADHRSDIYSFGATMFHMLTAKPPFTAKTPVEFFTRIRESPPPAISAVRGDVPVVLVTMIEKAMAKKPEDRYQTIGDMIGIMEQFLRAEFDSRQTAS